MEKCDEIALINDTRLGAGSGWRMSGGPARCMTLEPPDRSGPPEARSLSSTARLIPLSSSGLAYRLVTGVELDPNVDYSGGTESARFFQGLGLVTLHAPAQPVPPPQGQPSSSTPQRRQEPLHEAMAGLLRLRFGVVEREARLLWAGEFACHT